MLGKCLDRIARRSLEGLSLEFYAEVMLTLENELKQAEKACKEPPPPHITLEFIIPEFL